MTGRPEAVHVLYIDGGARGNPGPAGAGAVLYDDRQMRVAEAVLPLGRGTNNEAEYAGLARGLELARDAGVRRLEVRSDSELLVRQMTGAYRIRAPHLKAAADRARILVAGFASVTFVAVPREANREADRLANRAMDEAEGRRA